MSTRIRSSATLFALALALSIAGAAHGSTRVQRLSTNDGVLIDAVPKAGPGLDVATGADPSVPPPTSAFTWTLQAQNDGVFTDLSMADATHGFASAELGRVYRTTNGSTWTLAMNIGFPRYWYGVHAIDASNVFITGFQNQTGAGIGRWSTDGGVTWTNDIVIDASNWLTTNQFADGDHGVATAIGSGWAYSTTNGGKNAADWTRVLADPTQGWFAGNITFLPSTLGVYLCGISYCTSADGGASYTRRNSIDPVFDGGVSFPDADHGWTGGGQISAPEMGWVHRTTDGGATWSGRLFTPPYPIRSLLFLDESTGFAVGGNYFSATGGIWSTTDGGLSWNLDVNTGCEMKGIDWARVDADTVSVWSAGSRSGLGRIYRTNLYLPESTTDVASVVSAPMAALTISPNPSSGATSIHFDLTRADAVSIRIFDATGRTVRTLDLGPLDVGRHTTEWDGRDDHGSPLPAGVYYATSSGKSARSAPFVLLR